MTLRRIVLPALLVLLSPVAVMAAGEADHLPEYIKALEPQHGKIDLPGGIATIDLPDDLGYLDDNGTRVLRQKVYGNSFSLKTLGSIIPTSVPIGAVSSWNATIVYMADGHMADSPATLDSAALLAQIRKDSEARNAKLESMGYRSLETEVTGWASEPHYDAQNHTLTWALQLKMAGGEEEIHYALYLFGRNGTLQLDTGGTLLQLPVLERSIHKLSASIRFMPPYRYADFVAGTDKLAPYRLADLVTGHTHTPAKAQ